MNLTWHGLSCFELGVKTAHGDVTVVIDPYEASTGLRQRTLSAQLLLISHDGPDAAATSSVEGKPFTVRSPGEFEAKEVFVYGIAAPAKKEGKGTADDNLIFRVEAEDMRVAHLGALNRVLTNEELEQLKDIDILIVPVGGGRVLSSKLAVELVNQIEPRVVIPMTYMTDGLKEALEPVDAFFKTLGVAKPDEVSKFKIVKKDLPQEDMKVVWLSRD